MKKPTVLARLMGRGKPAPVVSSLALAALNRTLLVEPTHAEAIIGGYLSGTITSADTLMTVDRVHGGGEAGTAAEGDIGVINVTGGLVNRPMPGASGPGPANYVTLREQFDELLADDNVSAIVFRIESPGGMASGCFDLTDHVFAARGKKPIHALVDDYAFSAAYALAAACDEIWVSRTGGVGSVGVCGFHDDWSAGNAKMGLKVTAVYAGKHKIDFSQDFPLSDAAKARWQEMVDDDYVMFVDTVARYRGLDAEYVQKTEASLYFGQKAVAAKIATRLGTWDDLVAHLGSPDVARPRDDDDTADAEFSSVAPPRAMQDAVVTAVMAEGGRAAAAGAANVRSAADVVSPQGHLDLESAAGDSDTTEKAPDTKSDPPPDEAPASESGSPAESPTTEETPGADESQAGEPAHEEPAVKDSEAPPADDSETENDSAPAQDSTPADEAPAASEDAAPDGTPPGDPPATDEEQVAAAAPADDAPPAAAEEPIALETPAEAEARAEGLRAKAKVAVIGQARAAKFPDNVVLALADVITAAESIPERIAHTKQVINLCAAAGHADPIPFIRNHTEIAQVRTALVEARARADDVVRLNTTLPASNAEKSRQENRLDPTTVYRKRG